MAVGLEQYLNGSANMAGLFLFVKERKFYGTYNRRQTL
jgi:hypothetical protein